MHSFYFCVNILRDVTIQNAILWFIFDCDNLLEYSIRGLQCRDVYQADQYLPISRTYIYLFTYLFYIFYLFIKLFIYIYIYFFSFFSFFFLLLFFFFFKLHIKIYLSISL